MTHLAFTGGWSYGINALNSLALDTAALMPRALRTCQFTRFIFPVNLYITGKML